jgi:hypothetical protein
LPKASSKGKSAAKEEAIAAYEKSDHQWTSLLGMLRYKALSTINRYDKSNGERIELEVEF